MNTDRTPKELPLVSVIMPTYNRAHTLARAIHSVLAQTYENLELIVADDASTDNTAELIGGISDPRLIYVRQEVNRGPGSARNLGLAHAKGDYIAFQDSDDEWLLDKLRMQLEAMASHGETYGATFGGKLTYGSDPKGRYGNGLSDYYPHRSERVRSGRITSQLLAQNLISPQTLLMKTSVARETGPFDERLPNNEDWEFMLRMSTKTNVLFTDRPVVVAYISGDSISRNPSRSARSFMAITKKHQLIFDQDAKVYGEKMFRTGRYLHKLNRYKSAQKYLRRSIQLYPWSYKSWLGFFQAWLNGIMPRTPRRAQ